MAQVHLSRMIRESALEERAKTDGIPFTSVLSMVGYD